MLVPSLAYDECLSELLLFNLILRMEEHDDKSVIAYHGFFAVRTSAKQM